MSPYAGMTVSRRATLRGAALFGAGTMLGGRPATAGAPLRVGVVEGIGIAKADVAGEAMRRFGRPVVLVSHASWGALADHAAAGHGIEAAVLPVDAWWTGPLVTLARRPAAVLVLSPSDGEPAAPMAARPEGMTLGVAVRTAQAEAALRRWIGASLRLVALEPAALLDGVAAGLLDGAVLVGPPAASWPAGLRAVPLAAPLAAVILPRLALVPAGGHAFAWA